MAVYTEVGFEEADALLRSLGLGELTDLQGIRSGIEERTYGRRIADIRVVPAELGADAGWIGAARLAARST